MAPRVNRETRKKRSDGLVKVPFEKGAVMLIPGREGSNREPLRLVYAKKGEALPVPAGNWRVKNYTIETEYRKEYWALSITGMKGLDVSVVAGQTVKLSLQMGVRVNPSAFRKGEEIVACAGTLGPPGMGATVIRGKTRVPIGFRLRDLAGGEVGKGEMEYG